MSKIKKIWAREILDSRGEPTVEVNLMLDDYSTAVASVPSGASKGRYEALEIRDEDKNRFGGKGVLKAVQNVNQVISPAISGLDPTNLWEIDQKILAIDGTPNKHKLGANAMLAVSIACAKAASRLERIPLYRWIQNYMNLLSGEKIERIRIPAPIFNIINGGMHAAGGLDFQEFQLVSITSKPYNESLRIGVEVYLALKNYLEKQGVPTTVGDEGGFAPKLFTNMDGLELLVEVIKSSGFSMGSDILLGLDMAANTFYQSNRYQIKDLSTPADREVFIDFCLSLNEKYHLTILEDPLFEDDWEGWTKLTSKLSEGSLIVGDDLIATNPQRLQKAIETKACNAVIIKPNQIGTVSESIQVVNLARKNGFKIIVSHRSGETNDYFIADFAVGINADYVKFGAPARGERVEKYNRLSGISLEISNL